MLTETRAGLIVLLGIWSVVLTACGTDQPHTAEASTPVPVETTTSTPAPTMPVGAPVDSAGWEIVATTVEGRPIRARTFGTGPRKVLFIGGIHGDEPEGADTTTELPSAFDAAGLAGAVTLTILEDANPDGRAAHTRGNANGVDINRNFPASNFDSTNPSNGGQPLSQPESRAVVDLINRVHPDLVLVAHSWAGRQFINFDGPTREIADRFAATSGLEVEASTDLAPTPGSLGSYVGRDRGIPVLTIEVLKGTDQKAVWDKLRAALIQAIGG